MCPPPPPSPYTHTHTPLSDSSCWHLCITWPEPGTAHTVALLGDRDRRTASTHHANPITPCSTSSGGLVPLQPPQKRDHLLQCDFTAMNGIFIFLNDSKRETAVWVFPSQFRQQGLLTDQRKLVLASGTNTIKQCQSTLGANHHYERRATTSYASKMLVWEGSGRRRGRLCLSVCVAHYAATVSEASDMSDLAHGESNSIRAKLLLSPFLRRAAGILSCLPL